MSGEVYSFADGFDCSFVKRNDIVVMLEQTVPLHYFPDLEQVINSVTKGY